MTARQWLTVSAVALLVGVIAGAVGLVVLDLVWTVFDRVADLGEALGFE
jgi:hypothetical protein